MKAPAQALITSALDAPSDLNSKIVKQGELVRDLKAKKASKVSVLTLFHGSPIF